MDINYTPRVVNYAPNIFILHATIIMPDMTLASKSIGWYRYGNIRNQLGIADIILSIFLKKKNFLHSWVFYQCATAASLNKSLSTNCFFSLILSPGAKRELCGIRTLDLVIHSRMLYRSATATDLTEEQLIWSKSKLQSNMIRINLGSINYSLLRLAPAVKLQKTQLWIVRLRVRFQQAPARQQKKMAN